MPNEKNIKKVEKLKEKLTKSSSVIFAEYHGLDANKVNELRSKVKSAGAEMTIAKNTLMKIALKESKTGNKELEKELKGPLAVFFAYENSLAPLKAISEFVKMFELPKIISGIVDGEYLNAEKLNILSNIPSKDELIAKLIGTLKSPISGLANVLSGTQKNLIYALSAVAEQKQKNEEVS